MRTRQEPTEAEKVRLDNWLIRWAGQTFGFNSDEAETARKQARLRTKPNGENP